MIDFNAIPRLKEDSVFSPLSDDRGFLETRTGLRRIEGKSLLFVSQRIWPLLNGELSFGQILSKTQEFLEASEVNSILIGLTKGGYLQWGDTQEVEKAKSVISLAGDTVLAGKIGATFESAGFVLGDEGVEGDITVLLARSLFDPCVETRENELIHNDVTYFYAGIESRHKAFVGPMLAHGSRSPCFACFRKRRHSNSSGGKMASEYYSHIRENGGPVYLHEATPRLYLSLASAIISRIEETFAKERGVSVSSEAQPGQNLILVDRATRKETLHSLLPVPECGVCGRFQKLNSESQPIGLSAAVDSAVGIVHSLSTKRSTYGPNVYISGTTSADSSLIRSTMRAVNNGGAGYSSRASQVAAIGESLERYGAGLYSSSKLKLASWNELTQDAITPETFARFSDDQYESNSFPFVRFNRDTPVRWVEGYRWKDKSPVLVPASQVFLPYRRARGEAQIGQSISTGLAAGESLEQAVLSGLLEVIERDSLSISWMHRLPPRKIDYDLIAESLILSRYMKARSNWDVRFFDLTLDTCVSSVVAVMRQGTGADAVTSFGSASRANATEAAEKAFLEASQGISYIRRILPQYSEWDPGDAFSNVMDFNHHGILYSKFPALRSEVGYLFADEFDPRRLREPRGSKADKRMLPGASSLLDVVVSDLDSLGYETIVVDQTTADISLLGSSAVRVLVPGFVHLSGTHSNRLLGTPRLKLIPESLGVPSAPDNPYPHPLP